ncbi:MAG: peptidoglycan editing factor PgeF [Alphaproteobacteria bacterium]|nr:peptidoglycan editing factor PgeF [Alphaproteobacteria bacterium]MDX5370742.1 peptidoglycan editing factor PgeF [Alphaproteobacteria bacterium]MDX5465156.1 peptidoglycan editing factor PgeF [Alphaproteobacteria bacterium]
MTAPAPSRPTPRTASALSGLPGIRHGFFTRAGGVSQGLYAGLNCGFGSNDDAGAVAENRARVAAAMGVAPGRLLTVYQVHGADVATVTAPWAREDAPRADAAVTASPGIALGILTADCVPVLFADPQARVIGAAHAGWRGAKAGVLGATVEAMSALGADPARIHAAVGPAISGPAYEVGAEVRDAFTGDAVGAARFFRPSAREGHFLFDLPELVLWQLEALGLPRVDRLTDCTYGEEALFYSYRRATHRGEPDYGRQVSAIALA